MLVGSVAVDQVWGRPKEPKPAVSNSLTLPLATLFKTAPVGVLAVTASLVALAVISLGLIRVPGIA